MARKRKRSKKRRRTSRTLAAKPLMRTWMKLMSHVSERHKYIKAPLEKVSTPWATTKTRSSSTRNKNKRTIQQVSNAPHQMWTLPLLKTVNTLIMTRIKTLVSKPEWISKLQTCRQLRWGSKTETHTCAKIALKTSQVKVTLLRILFRPTHHPW